MGTDIASKAWEYATLGDAIAKVIGGGTPPRAINSYWKGSIPWASVKDFQDDTLWLYDTKEHISYEGIAKSAANEIKPNTLIICVRMAVGRAAIAGRSIAINQDLKALYPKSHLDTRYLLYFIHKNRYVLETLSIGSTVKGITTHKLLSIKISIPPIDEQHKIAQILDTLDAQIQQTGDLIAKLKQMRIGLLHDLLTRGIDENGEARDPVAHPEKFKEVSFLQKKIKIPEGWETKPLNSLLMGIDAGKSPSCPDQPAGASEWGVLKVSAIHPKGFRAEENKVIINPAYINTAYEVH